jgi:hypothetical protein
MAENDHIAIVELEIDGLAVSPRGTPHPGYVAVARCTHLFTGVPGAQVEAGMEAAGPVFRKAGRDLLGQVDRPEVLSGCGAPRCKQE